MRFTAKSRYVRYSPYKLRLLVDVVRGRPAVAAVRWLSTHPVKRIVPIKKMIESAIANARVKEVDVGQLYVKEIRVDQGPVVRYFKPGAMGRANIQRKRMSHLSVILETVGKGEN